MNNQRRDFMKVAGTALVTGAVAMSPLQAVAQTGGQGAGQSAAGAAATAGELTKHELPTLPYPYNALEPHIDARTMELHHDKHHKAYVDGLNVAELELAKARSSGNFALIQHWSRQLAFNYGGHFLHSMFWNVMSPSGGGEPTGTLAEKISRDFGSFELFKKQFSEAAVKVEGSGWALLHYRPADDRLVIAQAENQQKMAHWGATLLLGIDVWEHAYYLKYQNRRAEYVTAWWSVVNWSEVAKNLQAGMKAG